MELLVKYGAAIQAITEVGHPQWLIRASLGVLSGATEASVLACSLASRPSTWLPSWGT